MNVCADMVMFRFAKKLGIEMMKKWKERPSRRTIQKPYITFAFCSPEEGN